jgi:glycosyltransferase involved in cell wall biosynthesis
MACALPVVTTGVGAIGEIVRDGVHGLVVPPKDVGALAQAIERLKADPALRARLGAMGLAQARERFSMERMLDGMESVFELVLEGSPAGRVRTAH